MALNLINVHLSMILKWVAVVTLPTNGKLFFLPCEKWFFCSPSDGYWIFPRLLCSVVKKKRRRGISFVGRKKEIITTIASYNIFYTHLLYVRRYTWRACFSARSTFSLYFGWRETRRRGGRWRAKEPKSQPSERSPPQSWSSH